MLTELSIENFAIIDRLLVPLQEGFTVLTGETGAGKSIIIDALQAALGGRTGSDLVRGEARQAAVEAVFEWPDEPTAARVLAELGIEDEGYLILRREISAAGRSMGRVNGRAVPLSSLAAIGNLLVDIHGQSDHLSVLRRDRQLEALDRFGDLLSLRSEVGEAVREYGRLRRSLAELRAGQREMEQRLDLLRFQVAEIEDAQLQAEDDSVLEAERLLLANAERLAELTSAGYDALRAERGALDSLDEAVTSLEGLRAIDPALGSLGGRLETARLEVEDIAQELRGYRDAIEFDPRRLDVIETRLDLLTRLKRKYGTSLADVVAFGQRARAEMEEVENLDQRLVELEAEVDQAEMRAGALASELSARRVAAAERLNVAMGEALQGLGLRHTSFVVDLQQIAAEDGLRLPAGERYDYSAVGVDQVAFLVSFNPGEAPRPLERVASGGETSRFLLALKSVLAESDQTETLIFDEVDTGVGARNGIVVGERLAGLARTHQVISISHLPQVAALAAHHIHVIKEVEEGRTVVGIRELSTTERIEEIAEMMSGTGTEAARRNAQELLEAAQQRG